MRSSSGNRTFPPPFLSLSHTITLSLSFYLPIYLFPPFSFSFPDALGSSSLISTAQTVRHAVARYCYANDFCASEEPPGRSKTSRAAAKADLTCCNAHGKNAPARLDIFQSRVPPQSAISYAITRHHSRTLQPHLDFLISPALSHREIDFSWETSVVLSLFFFFLSRSLTLASIVPRGCRHFSRYGRNRECISMI